MDDIQHNLTLGASVERRDIYRKNSGNAVLSARVFVRVRVCVFVYTWCVLYRGVGERC